MARFDATDRRLGIDLLVVGPTPARALEALAPRCRAGAGEAPRADVRVVGADGVDLLDVVAASGSPRNGLRVEVICWGAADRGRAGDLVDLLATQVDGILVAARLGPDRATGDSRRDLPWSDATVPVVRAEGSPTSARVAPRRLSQRVAEAVHRQAHLAASGVSTRELVEAMLSAFSGDPDDRASEGGILDAGPVRVDLPIIEGGATAAGAAWAGGIIEAVRQIGHLVLVNRSDRERVERLRGVLQAASHDLRKPITALTSFVHLVARQADRLGPEAQRALRAARELLESFDEQIGWCLERPAAATDRERKDEIIDLDQLIETVTDQHRHEAGRAGIAIRASELPAVLGDRTELFSLFSNLVGNAVKYADASKVGRFLEIGWRRGVFGLLVYVADNGIGIPRADQGRVFERRSRAANVGQREGSGVGLSIVRDVMRQHDGKARLISEEGKGTCICLWFPDFRAVRGKARAESAPRHAASSGHPHPIG